MFEYDGRSQFRAQYPLERSSVAMSRYMLELRQELALVKALPIAPLFGVCWGSSTPKGTGKSYPRLSARKGCVCPNGKPTMHIRSEDLDRTKIAVEIARHIEFLEKRLEYARSKYQHLLQMEERREARKSQSKKKRSRGDRFRAFVSLPR